MAVGSGLGSQVGIAEETVWGSAVPVTRFFPIDGSNVKPMKKSVQGQGLQAGTYVHQGSLRADTSTWVQGDMTMDFTSKQMGLLFKHALGSASIVQNGTTAAWTQTWGLGNNVNGLGLTLQGKLTAPSFLTPTRVAKLTSGTFPAPHRTLSNPSSRSVGRPRPRRRR
jgi:hypothetical protein